MAPVEPKERPPYGVVLTVEVPETKPGRDLVTVSGLMAGEHGHGPVAAALGRLATKARFSLGQIGEAQIFARQGSRTGEEGIFARLNNAYPNAGDEGKGIFARVLQAYPTAADDRFALGLIGQGKGIFARVLQATPLAGEAAREGIFAHLVNATSVAGKAAKEGTVFTLGPISDGTEASVVGEAAQEGNIFANAVSPIPVAGVAGNRIFNDGEGKAGLISYGKKTPTLAPSCSTPGRFARAYTHDGKASIRDPRVPGFPMHSGASRLALAVGMVAKRGTDALRRSFSSVTQANPNTSDLPVRVAKLETTVESLGSRSTSLMSETTVLSVQASKLEVDLRSVRRGLTVVQIVVGGAGVFLLLSSATVWYFWDPVKIRAFFVDNAILGLSEHRDAVWKSSLDALTFSNASDTLSRWTGGYIGSTFSEQALKKERQLEAEKKRQHMLMIEALRWNLFMQKCPPGQGYMVSWAIYRWRDFVRQAEEGRQLKLGEK